MGNKRELPNWIDGFMLYTENTEPPRLFRKWTALSIIAAALQRKVRMEWGTSLIFYPNLYVVLVGKSATGKGTAMNPGLDLIRDLGTIRIAANATSLQALIRRLKETNLTDVDMITGKTNFHSSMTIYSKEFTVFLGYHNRELMAALCDWYDCDNKWSYDTISRSTEEIIGVWVNLIGGTTPDLIQSSLPIESIGGGLTSRIIFVYADKKDKIVPLPMQSTKDLQLYDILLQDLEKISMLSGVFKHTEGFSSAWHDFCYSSEENPPFYNPKFDGYLGRRRTHVMKLSMIMSAARGTHDLVVTRDDFEAALRILVEVEQLMPLVFRGVGRSGTSQMMSKVITYITGLKENTVPMFKLARIFSDDIDDYELRRILTTLEGMKLVKVINKPGADNIVMRLKDIENEDC